MIFVARQAEERVAFTFLFVKEIYLEDSNLWAFDATEANRRVYFSLED